MKTKEQILEILNDYMIAKDQPMALIGDDVKEEIADRILAIKTPT